MIETNKILNEMGIDKLMISMPDELLITINCFILTELNTGERSIDFIESKEYLTADSKKFFNVLTKMTETLNDRSKLFLVLINEIELLRRATNKKEMELKR